MESISRPFTYRRPDTRVCSVTVALLIGGVGAAWASAACTTVAKFTPLGNLDPVAEPAGSFASGISADGSIVVGTSFFFDGKMTQTRGFRWTTAEGIVNLGHPAGDGLPASAGGRISDNGATVTGSIGFVLNGIYELRNALFWQDADSNPLPTVLSLGLISTDVTADGLMIVGTTRFISPFPVPKEAFYWTADAGIVELGTLPDGSYSWADAVSAGGSVIVGYGDNLSHITAAKWTAKTGLIELPGLPGDLPSQASGVSADGSVIVGYVGDQAFRWTEDEGVVGIGKLPGASSAQGLDVSADGQVIVGYNYFETHDVAFIWDSKTGMRDLREVLITEFGMTLQTWPLRVATGVSDDGRSIVGYGINPNQQIEGWLVRFRHAEDTDDNGVVNVLDLLAVISGWGPCGETCVVDVNTDGIVNVLDLLAIINAWGECS